MKEKRAIQWIAPETAGEREEWKRKKTVNLSIYSLIRAIHGVRTRDPDLGKVYLLAEPLSRLFCVPSEQYILYYRMFCLSTTFLKKFKKFQML